MKKYMINPYGRHWVECDNAENATQEVIDNVPDVCWEDYIDDVCGEIDVFGYKYYASHILATIDWEAYVREKKNWLDGERGEIEREINRMEDGDREGYWGITVCCEEEHDEEKENYYE